MSNAGSHQSAARIPVVRHFLACERVERSQEGRRAYSLLNLFHEARPSPGASYPLICREMWLFTQMSDGRGVLSFRIQVVWRSDETSIFTSAPVTLNLGDDPLAVFSWPVRLLNVRFPRAGLYEFRLFCAGQEIAREPIVLRES